jgi:hypothetical protein
MAYFRLIIAAVLLSGICFADEVADSAVKILKQNCTGCHGASLKMSGLDLRSRESILAGGARGPAIESGKAENSRLYRFVAGIEKPSMPPGKTLAPEQVEILRHWIDAGASMPVVKEVSENVDAALAKMEERPITDQERKYWAFRAPVRYPVPNVGVANPIDAFLLAALKAKGLQAAPVADRRSLLRRAYLDLTGLPPSAEKVQAFLNDRKADAFSKVVEELLASPQYGERWGRHWLDVVRFADSGGFEYDRDRNEAWRYRDYVIRSFNDDKPYDRFVQEQIAGDEIAPESAEAHVATGYLRLGLENNLKNEQTRMDELDDLVSTTSNAFLGLTVGCARCHNHKFDPIPQKDYYRMQAVFFPAKPVEYPLVEKEEVARFKAEQKRITDLEAPWKARLAEIEKPYKDRLIAERKSKLPDYVQLALRTTPEKRTEGQRLNAEQVEKTLAIDEKDLLAALSAPDRTVHEDISKKIAELETQRPKPFATAMSIGEPGREAPSSHFLHRGSPGQRGSVMKPGVLSVASQGEWTFPDAPPTATTSWRRKGLAAWMASAENPLTARVMVNRIWQQHFGEGIVRTANNFGKMGERPTHPELLDWLATEFVQRSWSIKTMHRLMMNSQAYQRSSDDVTANIEKDGENRYLWRMPRRRLEAEAIRDSILSVAGNLDSRAGGPAVHPYIDPALFQASSKRTWVGKPDKDPETWRRSIYVFSKRSIPLPMLDVFDKPDSVGSCARRNRSTIAPQALILMNNAFVLMEAGFFAERVKREAGEDPAAQAKRAFEIALGRPPTKLESDKAVAFISGDAHGLLDFCQAVFNLNEFVYFP